MMSNTELLSQLIGGAYDAALDPALWPGVLERACSFVTGCAAMIFAQDAALKSGGHYYSWGDDPQFTRLYFKKYIKMSPFIIAQHLFEVCDVRTIYDLVPRNELVETQFYKEWMQPQQYLDNIFSNIDKSVTSYAAFAIVRHQSQGFADDKARRRMGLIAPHVRRAILIGNLIDLQRTEKAALTEALNGIASGVFLVRDNGHVVFANSAAQVMLAEEKIVRASRGAILAVNPEANKMLREVLGASKDGDAAVGVRGISISLSGPHEDRWVAHVLPLARRQADIPPSATAAIFVRKASLNLPGAIEIIAKTFDLTPGELRVLNAVVDIGGVSAVAEALGISEATVKTHLHHLFEKTGATRQADLVKLVAAHTNPIGT